MMNDEHALEITPQQRLEQRILIYTTCYNMLDGVSMTVRKIEQEILLFGGHVRVLTTRSGDMKNTHLVGTHPNRDVIFLKNSTVIPFVSDKDFDYHLGFSLGAEDIKSLDEFEPTLIHITVPDASSLSIIDYAREKSIPLMGTFHSNYVEYLDHYRGFGFAKPIIKGPIRHNYTFLQALYVPTPFVKKHLCSEEYQLNRCTNIKIWGRGYDTDKFSPSKRCNLFRQRIGAAGNDVIVCMVSRLVKEKRIDIFANVIRRLHRRGVPFRGLFIGAGPCEHMVEDLPKTYFAGWMSTDELSVAYASSDIFLFPSAVETFGNVTLEALGSGLPLVVEEGCSGHLVNHGENGYACAADDEDAFYEGTLELVLNYVKRKEFSVRAREHSLLFEQHTVVRKMVENYNEITEEFHSKYQGSHFVRDATVNKVGSFRAGSYGNPPGVSVIECFFFTAFRVIEMMVCTTACIHSRLFPISVSVPNPNDSVSSARKNVEVEPLMMDREESKLSNALVSDDISDIGDDYETQIDAGAVACGDTKRCIQFGEMFINLIFFFINAVDRLRSLFVSCCFVNIRGIRPCSRYYSTKKKNDDTDTIDEHSEKNGDNGAITEHSGLEENLRRNPRRIVQEIV